MSVQGDQSPRFSPLHCTGSALPGQVHDSEVTAAFDALGYGKRASIWPWILFVSTVFYFLAGCACYGHYRALAIASALVFILSLIAYICRHRIVLALLAGALLVNVVLAGLVMFKSDTTETAVSPTSPPEMYLPPTIRQMYNYERICTHGDCKQKKTKKHHNVDRYLQETVQLDGESDDAEESPGRSQSGEDNVDNQNDENEEENDADYEPRPVDRRHARPEQDNCDVTKDRRLVPLSDFVFSLLALFLTLTVLMLTSQIPPLAKWKRDLTNSDIAWLVQQGAVNRE